MGNVLKLTNGKPTMTPLVSADIPNNAANTTGYSASVFSGANPLSIATATPVSGPGPDITVTMGNGIAPNRGGSLFATAGTGYSGGLGAVLNINGGTNTGAGGSGVLQGGNSYNGGIAGSAIMNGGVVSGNGGSTVLSGGASYNSVAGAILTVQGGDQAGPVGNILASSGLFLTGSTGEPFLDIFGGGGYPGNPGANHIRLFGETSSAIAFGITFDNNMVAIFDGSTLTGTARLFIPSVSDTIATLTTVASSIGAFDTAPTATGLSLSGGSLALHAADGSNPGAISLVDQTLGAGNKLFSGNVSSNAGIYASGEVYGGAVFGGGATRFSQLAQHSLTFVNSSTPSSKFVDGEQPGQAYWYNFNGTATSINLNQSGIVSLGTYSTDGTGGELQVKVGGPVKATVPVNIIGSTDAVQFLLKANATQTTNLAQIRLGDNTLVWDVFTGPTYIGIEHKGQMQITGQIDQNELEVDGVDGQENPIIAATTSGNEGLFVYGVGSSSFAGAAVVAYNANLIVSGDAAGFGIRIKEGSNARQGVATLVAGAAVVPNTTVTASTRIWLTSQVDGGVPGFLRVSTRTNGTSFTITSSSVADTSTVAWIMSEGI